MDQFKNSSIVNNSYLIVTIDDVKYALHASNVVSILELTSITKIPHVPDYIVGIVNLRGTVLPVVDTRIQLGLPEIKFSPNTCIIVTCFQIDDKEIQLGLLVDFVNMVEEIFEENISSPPAIGKKYRSNIISGVTRIHDEFIMILEIKELFNDPEIKLMQEAQEMIME